MCLRRKLLKLEEQPLAPLALPAPSKGSRMLAARAKERRRLPWIDLRAFIQLVVQRLWVTKKALISPKKLTPRIKMLSGCTGLKECPLNDLD